MTKYSDIPKKDIKKVLTNSKKRMEEFLKNNRNIEFDSIPEIDADYTFPIVLDEFTKLGLSIKDAEKCTWEFMDDIYMGEELYDYVKSIVDKYNIITLNGQKTSAPRRRATPKKRTPAIKVNVRKMF